jgi:hypothetical protein
MAWFPLIIWAPPVEHPGDRPFILWTDVAVLTVLWFDEEGHLCRQDATVFPESGSWSWSEVIVDTSEIFYEQQIVNAQISPTGHLLIDTNTVSGS